VTTILRQHIVGQPDAAHPDVACGECGSPMVLRRSQKFLKNGGLFYGCTKFPQCRGTHGAHADGKPLGTPANKTTKAARMVAHAAFDGLWRARGWKRNDAYGWLAGELGIGREACHIAMFDAETCALVVIACRKFARGGDC